jgi:Arc/MetJ-type ribon-helix-helix transcriptional regulator
MKKKIYTRPVCIMLSQEMYEQVFELTDSWEISVSDYIRVAIHEMLKRTNDNKGESNHEDKNVSHIDKSADRADNLSKAQNDRQAATHHHVQDHP